MRMSRLLTALGTGGLLLAVSACDVLPPRQPPLPPPRGPAPVFIPAYAQGDVIGGHAARLKKARAAKIRPLTPAEISSYVAQQELDLRRQTAGTGVDVLRSGNMLLLRMPASGTFDVGKSEIRPQAVSTAGEIAWTLKKYNRSLVDVLGHTDSTGNPASNKALSQKRADAVAAYLRSRGVAGARIATRGYGADYPIADNVTEEGRAANRRVEIKVVPLR